MTNIEELPLELFVIILKHVLVADLTFLKTLVKVNRRFRAAACVLGPSLARSNELRCKWILQAVLQALEPAVPTTTLTNWLFYAQPSTLSFAINYTERNCQNGCTPVLRWRADFLKSSMSALDQSLMDCDTFCVYQYLLTIQHHLGWVPVPILLHMVATALASPISWKPMSIIGANRLYQNSWDEVTPETDEDHATTFARYICRRDENFIRGDGRFFGSSFLCASRPSPRNRTPAPYNRNIIFPEKAREPRHPDQDKTTQLVDFLKAQWCSSEIAALSLVDRMLSLPSCFLGTFLGLAASFGYTNVIKELMGKSSASKLPSVSSPELTALAEPVLCDDPDTYDELIQQMWVGAIREGTACNRSMVRFLCKMYPLTSEAMRGVLSHVAQKGANEVLKMIFEHEEHGAIFEDISEAVGAAVAVAAASGKTNTVKLLFNLAGTHGIYINVANAADTLLVTAFRGDVRTAAVLDEQVCKEALDADTWRAAFIQAVRRQHGHFIKYILRRHQTDIDVDTFQKAAYLLRHTTIFKILVREGACLFANISGTELLEKCAQNNAYDTLCFLRPRIKLTADESFEIFLTLTNSCFCYGSYNLLFNQIVRFFKLYVSSQHITSAIQLALSRQCDCMLIALLSYISPKKIIAYDLDEKQLFRTLDSLLIRRCGQQEQFDPQSRLDVCVVAIVDLFAVRGVTTELKSLFQLSWDHGRIVLLRLLLAKTEIFKAVHRDIIQDTFCFVLNNQYEDVLIMMLESSEIRQLLGVDLILRSYDYCVKSNKYPHMEKLLFQLAVRLISTEDVIANAFKLSTRTAFTLMWHHPRLDSQSFDASLCDAMSNPAELNWKRYQRRHLSKQKDHEKRLLRARIKKSHILD